MIVIISKLRIIQTSLLCWKICHITLRWHFHTTTWFRHTLLPDVLIRTSQNWPAWKYIRIIRKRTHALKNIVKTFLWTDFLLWWRFFHIGIADYKALFTDCRVFPAGGMGGSPPHTSQKFAHPLPPPDLEKCPQAIDSLPKAKFLSPRHPTLNNNFHVKTQ